MEYRTITLRVLVVALFLTTTFNLFAQEEPSVSNSLRDQWTEMIKSSETYKDHKIIKVDKLGDYRNALGDSLSAYSSSIDAMKKEKGQINEELKVLKSELDAVKMSLLESEEMNGSISFLGLSLKQTTYNIVVWSIVALLAVLVLAMYTKMKKVCSVAKRIKTSYSKIKIYI